MKYVFIGLESKQQNWTPDQFKQAAQRIKDNGYDTVLFKVADGAGVGDTDRVYYTDVQLDAISNVIKGVGLAAIPYVYSYGDKFAALSDEIAYALHLMQRYGSVCADMEAEWNGQTQWAQKWNSAFLPVPGVFYVSTWANIADQNWQLVARTLEPCVNFWLPQVYTSYLLGVYRSQWNKYAKPLYPTYRLATIENNQANYGLWEYGDLPTVTHSSDSQVISLVTPSQFEPNETQYACGFFAAAELKYAMPPGKNNTTNPELIDAAADAWYKLEYGSFDISQYGGVSIDDMHRLLGAAGIHYNDLSAISPNSSQASDIAQIKAALSQGYPVVATIREGSVHDIGLGGACPYYWADRQTQSTHVFIYTGIAVSGNLLAHDTANITGTLNGQNSVRTQPREYDIAWIENHWCTMAVMNWLPRLPNNYNPVTKKGS